MRLFGKIFTAVLVSFIIVGSLAVYAVSVKQISYACKNILEQNRIISRFLAKEIEVGYAQSQWPFENLAEVSKRKDFLFWWVVRDDGVIHLADKASFMGTAAYSYFPQLADIKEEENAILDHKQNHGIFVKALEIGKKRWLFLLGFSLQDLLAMKKSVIISSVLSFILILLILGVLLYFMVKYLTRPIRDLVRGAEIIGGGDLAYRVKIETRDELGELAGSFNKMAENLHKTTTSIDSLNKEINERKEAQEMLRKTEEKYRILFEEALDAIFVADVETGILVDCNLAALRLIDREKSEVIGKPQLILHPPEEAEGKFSRTFKQHLKEKEGQVLEMQIITKRGEIKDVAVKANLLEIGGKKILQGIFRDITEQKKMEEELKNKMQDLERFNRLAVDRELKMAELKKKIAELEAKTGQK